MLNGSTLKIFKIFLLVKFFKCTKDDVVVISIHDLNIL